MRIKDTLSITFLYPSMRVGGAQLLFIRLAIELSKYDDLLVNVVDYPCGYLESQLKSYDRITILPYINGSVAIGDETVLVTPLSNFADLTHLVEGNFANIKVLLWCIHPSNLDFVFNGNARKWFRNKKKLKSFIEMLSDAGNIVYMDEANFLAVNELVPINKKPEYLQIPMEIKDYISTDKSVSKKLNIAWLGRISYDKVYSIIKIIDEIKLLADWDKVVFHVIGVGEKFNLLESYLKESGIDYILKGTLEGDDLSKYMLEKIDLGVAMGTSCMEFAARKIPVFIIDFSEEEFPKNVKYNWLFETQNYTLGSHINSVTNRNHVFFELINEYKKDNTLGQKCYQYVVDNHDIKVVALKLIERCENLKYIELPQFNTIQKMLNPSLYIFFCYLYRKGKNIFSAHFNYKY